MLVWSLCYFIIHGLGRLDEVANGRLYLTLALKLCKPHLIMFIENAVRKYHYHHLVQPNKRHPWRDTAQQLSFELSAHFTISYPNSNVRNA